MLFVTAALALAAAGSAPRTAPTAQRVIEAGRVQLEAELDALEARAKAENWRGPSTREGKRTVDHAFDGAGRLWMLCAMAAAERLAKNLPSADAAADAAVDACVAFESDFRRASALGYREMGASDPDRRSELVRRDARIALRRIIGGMAGQGAGNR